MGLSPWVCAPHGAASLAPGHTHPGRWLAPNRSQAFPRCFAFLLADRKRLVRKQLRQARTHLRTVCFPFVSMMFPAAHRGAHALFPECFPLHTHCFLPVSAVSAPLRERIGASHRPFLAASTAIATRPAASAVPLTGMSTRFVFFACRSEEVDPQLVAPSAHTSAHGFAHGLFPVCFHDFSCCAPGCARLVSTLFPVAHTLFPSRLCDHCVSGLAIATGLFLSLKPQTPPDRRLAPYRSREKHCFRFASHCALLISSVCTRCAPFCARFVSRMFPLCFPLRTHCCA